MSPQAPAGRPLTASRTPWPADLPVYDHVVIVVEENKDYAQVIGSRAAPYINGTLKKEGANLLKMYAEEHHSEGNYFWLFSGSNQGVGFGDAMPAQPITAHNLGAELIAAGRSFAGYAEDLPAIGSTVTSLRAVRAQARSVAQLQQCSQRRYAWRFVQPPLCGLSQ